MIVGTPSAWSKANSELLAQFLQGGTGQLFLATLAVQRPALGGPDSVESVALRAKLVEGYERAIATILSLTEDPSKTEVAVNRTDEEYPDLDDNQAWEKRKTTATPK